MLLRATSPPHHYRARLYTDDRSVFRRGRLELASCLRRLPRACSSRNGRRGRSDAELRSGKSDADARSRNLHDDFRSRCSDAYTRSRRSYAYARSWRPDASSDRAPRLSRLSDHDADSRGFTTR